MPSADPRSETPIHLAQQRRTQKRIIRQNLRTGQLTLTELMADPPIVMRNVTLADILQMRRATTRAAHPSVMALGQRAMRDGINLLVPLGQASARSRAWVAEYGDFGCHNQRDAA